jgi:hypothetical protein
MSDGQWVMGNRRITTYFVAIELLYIKLDFLSPYHLITLSPYHANNHEIQPALTDH